MAFDQNHADDLYQLDQCIEEIKSLQSQLAAKALKISELQKSLSTEKRRADRAEEQVRRAGAVAIVDCIDAKESCERLSKPRKMLEFCGRIPGDRFNMAAHDILEFADELVVDIAQLESQNQQLTAACAEWRNAATRMHAVINSDEDLTGEEWECQLKEAANQCPDPCKGNTAGQSLLDELDRVTKERDRLADACTLAHEALRLCHKPEQWPVWQKAMKALAALERRAAPKGSRRPQPVTLSEMAAEWTLVTEDQPPVGRVVTAARYSHRGLVYQMPLVRRQVTSHRVGWFAADWFGDGELQVMDEPTHWKSKLAP